MPLEPRNQEVDVRVVGFMEEQSFRLHLDEFLDNPFSG
jgi:hypothetical protein